MKALKSQTQNLEQKKEENPLIVISIVYFL